MTFLSIVVVFFVGLFCGILVHNFLLNTLLEDVKLELAGMQQAFNTALSTGRLVTKHAVDGVKKVI